MESGTEAKDELVGFCNINLKPLFGLLSPLSLEDLKAFLHNQGNDLLELTNKYMEIQTLRAGEVQGYLKVYLGAGNIKQIGFYNKAHLSNDSRLIGVDPMTFGFGSDKIPLRRRDPKKKTAFKFNLSDLEFLAKNPYLKSILDSLIQQLNSGQIAVEEFHLKILGEVMKKFPDPEIIAFLHELLPRAEECNPIWVPEYSRKPYITRDSHQFQYDSKDKKFYQIVENGERVPMQRCVFKGPQMKEEEVFVDKKAMIIKKNDKAIRKISKRQMKELKMLNGEIPEAPEEEEMDVPVYSVPEGADVDALIRKALNLREFERLKKLEKEKAEADQMRKNETGDAKPELEKSYPSGERSNQGSLSNWSKVKNKLMSQKALVNRSEEMYGDKSHENSVIAEMNTPMNRKMKVRVGARVHTPNITNDWKNDSSASSVRRNGSMDSGKPDDKEQSDSKHFELIKVGMALYGGRSISDLSEDEMSSVVQLKNIQLIDEESRSFEMPNSEIEQYATDLGDAFISDDVLMSFTILLEYLRRFVMSNQDLRKRMKYLLLGQFQSSLSKEIGFEDLEYILRNYLVEIDQKEAKSLFTFLCEKKTNMLNLVDLHDSLFTYIKLYLEYTTEYLTPLHYVLQKVTQKPQGMQDLIEFMCAHSVDMHIDKSTLFSYLENVAEINNLDLIEHQLLEFGEFVYFDRIYIVNIINILLFLKEQGDRKFDPHYIKALHSYEAYFKLVARKIKDHAHQLYAEKDPTLEVIGLFQKIDLEFTNGRESPGLSKHESDESQSNTDSKGSKEVGYNLGQFREVIGRLGFKDITVFETMIIFYFIHDMRTKLRLGLKKGQKLASRDIELFFKIVLADQPALVEGVAELNLNWALEGLVKTGALQSLIKDQSFVSRGSKATKRKKLKTELIETNRVVYNLTFNIRGLESLALASDFDYADLSIRFNFPGEEAPFETQLFTYIPSETSKPGLN
jgi:hypothetical protein